MNVPRCSLLLILGLSFPHGLAAQSPEISLDVRPDKVRVNWTLPPGGPDHALTTRHWQLQRSDSLGN